MAAKKTIKYKVQFYRPFFKKWMDSNNTGVYGKVFSKATAAKKAKKQAALSARGLKYRIVPVKESKRK